MLILVMIVAFWPGVASAQSGTPGGAGVGISVKAWPRSEIVKRIILAAIAAIQNAR